MKVAIISAMLLANIGLAQANNVEKGKAILETAGCVACHGSDYKTTILPAYPKLAGQYPDYLYYALIAYKVGNSNAEFGRNNAIMGAQVAAYSDAELKAMAAYIATLPGPFVIKK
uniref:c-type cytochrome n=1 Tax=Polynucleobacter sp. TaxID=2029855 RepID=UPI00404875BB